MSKKEINVLAVNPGTKYVGIAVFHGPDLVYWGLKVLKGRWSDEKLKRIGMTICGMLDQYDVTTIMLKKLDTSKSSCNLDTLVASIQECAQRKKVPICSYTLSELKNFLELGNRVNKMEIAGLAVARYQFLIHQLERERKHKHPYFIRMFEAIAAGILAFNRINGKRKKEMKNEDI